MKKALPFLVMLSIIFTCEGCSLGWFDRLDGPVFYDFYLGNDFTIDSIGNKNFKNTNSSLHYYVDNINPINKNATEIAIELDVAISAKLILNHDINHELGNHTITDDMLNPRKLIIEFPITITQRDNVSNNIEAIYSFTIKFKGEPPPVNSFNFYLGDDFTIESIGSKGFATVQPFLNYEVDSVDIAGQNADTIKNQLEVAIDTELYNSSTIYHTLTYLSTTGDIGFSDKLVITFSINLTQRDNLNNSIDAIYSFTIKFNDEFVADPWDGKTSTMPDNSTDGYYLIKTPANLAWLVQQTKVIDKNVRFLSDIDMDNHSFDGIKEFTGIFDGNNKSIKKLNITINKDATIGTATALIHKVTGDTTIKNLTLNGGKITGDQYVGSFVGVVGSKEDIDIYTKQHQFTIDNSTSDIKLVSNNMSSQNETIMGGFVGVIYNASITIINSTTNSGTISNTSNSSSDIGGFIGRVMNSDMMMKNLENNIDISSHSTGKNTMGGILGQNIHNSKKQIFIINIDNVTNNGNILSSSNIRASFAGGIIGLNNPSLRSVSFELIITNVRNNKTISADSFAGGVIGLNSNSSTSITNTYNKGAIKSMDRAVVGSSGGIIGESDNEMLTTIIDSYNNGDISGGKDGAGGIIGNHGGDGAILITNTYNSGNISNIYKYAGGLIGENINWDGLDIRSSYNTGTITGKMFTGGIIGKNNSEPKVTITNTYNTGDIISIDTVNPYVGGLIGHNSSVIEITSSYNTGDIIITNNATSNNYGGGIIGKDQLSTIITSSYNTGDIKSSSSVSDQVVAIGGLVGLSNKITISDSYNTGNISTSGSDGTNHYVGGIIGSIIEKNIDSKIVITDTYNVGDIESDGTSGGIIGNSYFDDDKNELTISQSFSYGDIYGDKSTGAILGTAIGLSPPIFTNNYWYALRTPDSNIIQIGGDRLEVDEFKSAESFEGWGVNIVGSKWEILERLKYPTLISNKEVTSPAEVIK